MELYDFKAATMDGGEQSLSEYKGKVLLIVNTASKCGFTPQFAGLQSLYDQFQARQFEILGFPCNQFSGQDPGSNEEILQFCTLNYHVAFPMFAKVNVKGKDAHPLFKYLTRQAPGAFGLQAIKWNFTKFLVDRNGKVVRRYAPNTTPDKIEKNIHSLLED